jgi:citrate lyase subunit beta / citryl-CoA lyase
MPFRLRRSELATPGSNPKMIARALASDADLVFLDLEDSVAPTMKATARAEVTAVLRDAAWGDRVRAVRINALDGHHALDDVIAVVGGAPGRVDVLIVPKVRTVADVAFLDVLLGQLERKHGLATPIGLELLIEEVEALARVDELARASPRTEALIFGIGDMAASQGVRVDAFAGGQGSAEALQLWQYHRSRIVVAARAAGIDAIDGPFASFGDLDGYRREAAHAAAMGFVGKWAIHPAQLAVANEVYAPTDAEIGLARSFVARFEAAAQLGEGATAAGGIMIDAATARIGRNLLLRAERAGKVAS